MLPLRWIFKQRTYKVDEDVAFGDEVPRGVQMQTTVLETGVVLNVRPVDEHLKG